MYNILSQATQKADPFKQAAIQKIKQQVHVHATMKNQVNSRNNELLISLKILKRRTCFASLNSAGLFFFFKT